MAKRFIGGGDSDVAPAGSVQAFAGASAPHGWLLCDGSVLNTSDYPKLSAALNGAWDSFAHPVDGTPTVGAGQFALPNMKGLYLAGTGDAGGDARSLGVFQAQKTAKNGLNIPTSGGHQHSISHRATTAQSGSGSTALWDGSPNNTKSRTASSDLNGINSAHTHTINGDTETRPVTAPVNYIIKY